MKHICTILFFFVINFGALYVGSLLSLNGPQSDWYLTINKAPWTPPGWVFGSAWTTIMICFSFYLAYIFKNKEKWKTGIILFIIQLILNISWNPLFFCAHNVTIALINIILLFIVVCTIFITYINQLKLKSILLIPYITWLIIAISLNLYIWIYN